jgi:hypothetical protein
MISEGRRPDAGQRFATGAAPAFVHVFDAESGTRLKRGGTCTEAIMADEDLLHAVLDCIIPADRDPGALELGTDRFVRARLTADPEQGETVANGLTALDVRAKAARGARFCALDVGDRVPLLEQVETEPWFALLVTYASWGFYADPGNGGNADAASWTMIGYEHRLPEGPDGPPGGVR